jgi:hypothetical protein
VDLARPIMRPIAHTIFYLSGVLGELLVGREATKRIPLLGQGTIEFTIASASLPGNQFCAFFRQRKAAC